MAKKKKQMFGQIDGKLYTNGVLFNGYVNDPSNEELKDKWYRDGVEFRQGNGIQMMTLNGIPLRPNEVDPDKPGDYKMYIGDELIENYVICTSKRDLKLQLTGSYNEVNTIITSIPEKARTIYTGKIIDFSEMFVCFESLSDISHIANWDVSNGKYFSNMFTSCFSLSDISHIANWDVSKGNDFSRMFTSCRSLSDISPLTNWDVSNGVYFYYMFSYCESLSDISHLFNWDISKGNHFSGMFGNIGDTSNGNIDPIVIAWQGSPYNKLDTKVSYEILIQ